MASLSDLERDLKAFGKAVKRETDAAQASTADATRREAVRRSSGGFSSAQLRKMGHPYATRHGSPQLDPTTINAQTGVFRSDWAVVGAPGSLKVLNTDPIARYLESGTRTMFARPLGPLLVAFANSTLDQEIRSALARAQDSFPHA